MIKSAHFMFGDPNSSLGEILQHWHDFHGPAHAGPGTLMQSYKQHHTLISAYGGPLMPTHLGCSICEWKDLASALNRDVPSRRAAAQDGANGLNGKPPFIIPSWLAMGTEVVQKEGATTPFMVKGCAIIRFNPDLPEDEVRDFWATQAGPATAKLPGLRRYVQNHGIKEARHQPGISHDGWAETWFDDLDSYIAAQNSPEAAEIRRVAGAGLGKPIFEAASRGFVIGREREMIGEAWGR